MRVSLFRCPLVDGMPTCELQMEADCVRFDSGVFSSETVLQIV